MPDYRKAARASAARYGIDPDIFERQIAQESGFNPNARSGAGALGIAQFMPATAKGYGVDPMDPMSALDGAARMDAANLKKYGSYERMLSAYNSGRADAYKDPNFAKGQTYNYVRSILDGHTPSGAANLPRQSRAVNQVGNAAFGGASPARTQLIAGLLGTLQSFAQTGKAMGATDPQQFISAALSQVLASRQAGNAAAAQTQAAPQASAAPVPHGGKLSLSSVPDTWSTRKGIDVNHAILPNVVGIAERFGVKVNSGYRSAEHNASVGGASHSDHLGGNAVDFTGSPAAMKKLYDWAQGKFPYVEPWGQAGGNHVHISFIR